MEVKIEKNIPIPKTEWENIKEYKKAHVNAMTILKKGESIKIKNRTFSTAEVWVSDAIGQLIKNDRKENINHKYLHYTKLFLIKSIDKKTQRVWRVK